MEPFLVLLARLRTRLYTAMLRSSLHSIGRGSLLTPPLRFHHLKGVQVGNHVLINGGCWIQSIADDSEKPTLIIKDHAHIGMNATLSAARRIVIGEHVLLGRNVYIADHGHEYRARGMPIVRQGICDIDVVEIGEDSWIGQNAVILPGATIGRHCVIGANAVVNSAVPDYCVAAGVPARIIRHYDPSKGNWETGHS